MANTVVFGGNAMQKREQRGQKQRRASFKKEKRKRKRQALAKLRDSELLEDEPRDLPDNDNDDDDEEEERKAEVERQRLHQEWLQREALAQEEFRLRTEREDAARKRREDEERRIKEEWEEQQRKEKEERDRKQQEKMDREEAVQKMLDQAESQLQSTGPWKNPEAPVDYGTEKDRANCPFFLKTGSCRFGDRCSRVHVRPTASTTLMVKGMFVTFSMEQVHRDDYDTDASLEYSEDDVHQHFLDFYQDVLPEFRNVGKVVQFKVSCNFEPHLRGNVYVQFETEDQCREAFVKFNGRYYAGKQLQCEFSPVTRWKTAICGLFDRNKCPKGKHCNFLHVYRNPTREFWEADRDLHTSPNGAFTGSRSERFSERFSERRPWSSRRYDRSPDRSGGGSRDPQQSERGGVRGRRSGRERRSPSPSEDGDAANGSPGRKGPEGAKRRRSGTGSPKPVDKRGRKPSEGSPAPRRHKRSKKSGKKKKSKKKKRENRSVSPAGSSLSDGEAASRPLSPPSEENPRVAASQSLSPPSEENPRVAASQSLSPPHEENPREAIGQPLSPPNEENPREVIGQPLSPLGEENPREAIGQPLSPLGEENAREPASQSLSPQNEENPGEPSPGEPHLLQHLPKEAQQAGGHTDPLEAEEQSTSSFNRNHNAISS
ncbi:hypothetical protein COCON_G00200200 [Conger conger]|uniref:Uncharacterized protein n=1 Tax=Conger conger TaxID=82655 RepID=A0A9Q1HPM0_CONCO|nr:hypothetical protein COCON_G00200200 [Conger conger]